MISAEEIKEALTKRLQAESVVVEEISGCGASYEVHIVSPLFEGKRLLDRQRLVNEALSAFMPLIHALSIKKAWTPAQQAEAAGPSGTS